MNDLVKSYPRLKEAYHLKNELDQWFKESSKENAKDGFETCMIKMQESGIEAFRRVSKTFKRWKEEILNSFTYPFSNGYIEGVNNTIKVLKRNSCGIKSFERLRNKILWHQEIKRII